MGGSTVLARRCFSLAVSAAVLLATPVEIRAHEDRIFEVGSDGSISGLPKDYLPASLLIGPPQTGGRLGIYPPFPKVTLVVSGVERQLPPCVAQLFRLPPGEKMALHGSWYHDLSLLPPYLVIDLPSHTYSGGWFTGYKLLFNLTTGELLELTQVVVTPGHGEKAGGLATGSTMREVPAYEAICAPRLGPDFKAPAPCGWFRRLTRRCS